MVDEANTTFEYLNVLKKTLTMIYGLSKVKQQEDHMQSEGSDNELLQSVSVVPRSFTGSGITYTAGSILVSD